MKRAILILGAILISSCEEKINMSEYLALEQENIALEKDIHELGKANETLRKNIENCTEALIDKNKSLDGIRKLQYRKIK
jgi:flagellar biosynthesis chaperone FliJ